MAIDMVAKLPIPPSGSDPVVLRKATSAASSTSAGASAPAVPIFAPASDAHQQPPATNEVQAAISHLNDYLAKSGRAIQYHMDDATGMTVVTVTDTATGDVIRQIPNEEVLKLAQSLKDTTAKGANALLHLAV